MKPTDGFWSRRAAAWWFRRIARRPELAHLGEEERERVAAEVVVELAAGFWGQVLFNTGAGLILVLGFAATVLVPIVVGAPTSWHRGACWIGFASAPGLLAVLAQFAGQRARIRRLLREAVRRRESTPAVEPWREMVRGYKAALGRPWSETMERGLAARWSERLRDLPQIPGLACLDWVRLTAEAAEKAASEPLVRTLGTMLWIVWPCSLLICMIALPALFIIAGQGAPVSEVGFVVIFVLAVGPVLYVAQDRRGRSLARRHLREILYLEGVRPARCFDCREDLTASAGPRCPRCGAQVERVG
ncbi:MAG: hypothetical protein HY721_09775 [Planctomycetes bacterium]|nr:hypothetical protein [Planctomycetota bacterium]